MAVNKQALVAAVSKFRADTATAVKFHDPERTNTANTKRKHLGVMEARAALLKAMPAEPEALLAKSGLTPAETQVALILGRGLTAAEAADELNLSRATVATHRKSIYKKLNIHSQHELILKLAVLSE